MRPPLIIAALSVCCLTACSLILAPLESDGLDVFLIGDPDEAAEVGPDGDLDGDADRDGETDASRDFEPDLDHDLDVIEDADGALDANDDSDLVVGPDADCRARCGMRECGPDGCGGTCPPGCAASEVCDEGVCVCVRNCGGRECGPDGCSGFCPPGCGIGEICEELTGTCERDCTHNSRWGAACSGTTICTDGSGCVTARGLASYGSICSPTCDEDTDCLDIARGAERCGISMGGPPNCFVVCEDSGDCVCGMTCRAAAGGLNLCYP